MDIGFKGIRDVITHRPVYVRTFVVNGVRMVEFSPDIVTKQDSPDRLTLRLSDIVDEKAADAA